MRSAGVIALLVAAIGMPRSTYAQPGKFSAAVVLPEIEMKAGASWKMPATGKLKKGEQVIIHHEDENWVAILPPPGAISWVNHRFLGEFDPNHVGKQNALIMADNVEVRVGADKGGPLAVTQIKLPRGTWVEIVGAKVKDDTSTWYPITPPEGEYRWLPKSALGAPAALAPPPVFVKSTTTPPQSPPGSDRTPGTLTSLGTKAVATGQIPQWDQAEQAERSGNYALAEKLYTSIYNNLRQKNADPEQVLVCYNRIIKCQDRIKLDGTPGKSNSSPSSGFDSKSPAGLLPPTGSSSGAVGLAWPNSSSTASGQRSSGTGNLRKAGFAIDGKQAYALENARGQVLYYVTSGNGVSLDTSVNKQVELIGNVQTRGDVRGALYMVVSQVNAK